MVARELLDLGELRTGLRNLRRGGAGFGSGARRRGVSRRLDRAALRRRRAGGGAPLRRGERDRRDAAVDRARGLLAGARRRGDGPGRGGAPLLRARRRSTRSPITASSRRGASGRARTRVARAGDRRPRRRSRDEATRVVEWLYAAGLDDLATPLAEAAAGRWRDEAQIAALAEVVAAHADATTNVEFGKIATERGFALDATAFPTFGVPPFAPLPHSADLASVYAVARQESEFAWRAVSGAGAKGLMQILPVDRAIDRAPRRRRLRPLAPQRRSRVQPSARRGVSSVS